MCPEFQVKVFWIQHVIYVQFKGNINLKVKLKVQVYILLLWHTKPYKLGNLHKFCHRCLKV